MIRRSFLSLLSAAPFLGWLKPKPVEPEPWTKLGFVYDPDPPAFAPAMESNTLPSTILWMESRGSILWVGCEDGEYVIFPDNSWRKMTHRMKLEAIAEHSNLPELLDIVSFKD